MYSDALMDAASLNLVPILRNMEATLDRLHGMSQGPEPELKPEP